MQGRIVVSSDAGLLELLDGENEYCDLPLGEVLRASRQISEQQLQQSLNRQKHDHHKQLGRILVENGILTDEQVSMALAQKCGIPCASLEGFAISDEIRSLISVDI
ncbi:MAG: hypothetical protein GWO08_16030, partial [Gammaproteobacteria bacterium]|nr:hypothetical protein [Gammaproteobacteria bacterium]